MYVISRIYTYHMLLERLTPLAKYRFYRLYFNNWREIRQHVYRYQSREHEASHTR